MKKLLSVLAIALIAFTTFNVHATEDSTENKKVLVAYFSATGTTAGVAEKLATVLSADLFEIKPEQIYTEADLNWRDEDSRTSVEMKDRSSRPAIASKVENIDQYNVIFVGFPIWWGREPSIIDTFMESYDFTGKKVVPFATAGSGDIGDSGSNLQALAPNASVDVGKRFFSSVSEEELFDWAKAF